MSAITKNITSVSWTAITSAGEDATAWIDKVIEGNGVVLVNHSNSGTPFAKHGFRLKRNVRNNDITILGAEDDNDVFYARLISSGSVRIMVDAE